MPLRCIGDHSNTNITQYNDMEGVIDSIIEKIHNLKVCCTHNKIYNRKKR